MVKSERCHVNGFCSQDQGALLWFSLRLLQTRGALPEGRSMIFRFVGALKEQEL